MQLLTFEAVRAAVDDTGYTDDALLPSQKTSVILGAACLPRSIRLEP
jgi:hypothetical protein